MEPAGAWGLYCTQSTIPQRSWLICFWPFRVPFVFARNKLVAPFNKARVTTGEGIRQRLKFAGKLLRDQGGASRARPKTSNSSHSHSKFSGILKWFVLPEKQAVIQRLYSNSPPHVFVTYSFASSVRKMNAKLDSGFENEGDGDR